VENFKNQAQGLSFWCNKKASSNSEFEEAFYKNNVFILTEF